MDVSKIKIGNIVYSIKDETARKAIEAAKISFSNLQDACTALGITAKSYTTEEFVKAMPFNTYVQFTHNKNDTIKITDMPVDYASVEFQKGRTVNYCRGTAVHTTTGTLYLYKYESSSSNNAWRKAITETDDITRLKEYANRPTSADRAPASDDSLGTIEYFLASSKMTSGKPSADGHILQFNWDNSNGWDSQLALINGKDNCVMQHRGMSNGVWGGWKTNLDSSNYTDYTAAYEKGTWSAKFKNVSTVQKTATGKYTKIGNMVFVYVFSGQMNLLTIDRIDGLPFPISALSSMNLSTLFYSTTGISAVKRASSPITSTAAMIETGSYNTIDLFGWYEI